MLTRDSAFFGFRAKTFIAHANLLDLITFVASLERETLSGASNTRSDSLYHSMFIDYFHAF